MAEYQLPHLITFRKTGEPGQGYINIAELEKDISFPVKRIFWTYDTPESVIRGKHAHYETEQILIAVSGRIVVTTEMGNGEKVSWLLDNPNVGVYLPPNAWHTMQYSENAIQLVLASTLYKEEDYIRTYEKFKAIYKG